VGTIWKNCNPDAKRFPYLVKFDDPRCETIYTNMAGNNIWHDDLPDTGANTVDPDEIVLIQQVVPTREVNPDLAIRATLLAKLEDGTFYVDPTTMDPEKDALGTGTWELRIEEGTPQQQVHSHNPIGAWLGTLTLKRLRDLRGRWEAKAGQHTRPSFEWEVAQAFARYRPNTLLPGGGRVKLSNHWSTEDGTRLTIHVSYTVSSEMYSSVFNYHIDVDSFYSASPQDVALGAIYNAYSINLRGLSVYMNPEYEHAELCKALKWAIAASQHHLPFSAVLVYLRWKDALYMSLLQHRNVRLIAKFKRNTFSFMTPTHWEQGVGKATAGTAKWQVMFIHVSNQQGRDAFMKPGADEAVIQAAVAHGAVLATYPDKAFDTQEFTKYNINPPTGYNKAKRARPAALPLTITTTYMPKPFPTETRLCNCTGLQVYTDGSKMDEGLGAGYVIVNEDGGLTERMKVAGPQTVNRSEFVGQYVVLEDVPPEREVSVYTDSLVSIQKLISWITDPASLDRDKHQDVVRDIATMIAHRQGPYKLRKVPAHKDMKWNEVADAFSHQFARTAGLSGLSDPLPSGKQAPSV